MPAQRLGFFLSAHLLTIPNPAINRNELKKKIEDDDDDGDNDVCSQASKQTMRLPELPTGEATAIRKSVNKYQLKQWGFVIFRCTYKSQEKWDQFIGLAKEHASDYFEWRDMEDLYESMAWTIIEDAETLEGASLATTAQKFVEWVEGPEGRQDRAGSLFDTDDTVPVYGPRYTFFLHVDEESLESVVDDEKAREDGGYFCKAVKADMALAAEQERRQQEEGGGQAEEEEWEQDEEDEEEELLDVRKRVKLNDLAPLYAFVLNTNAWYNILVEDGVVKI